MGSMDNLTICCADIGSVARGRFGWASHPREPDRTDADAQNIEKLAAFVARRLEAGDKVALGFECPLWIPVADHPVDLTRGRANEGNRPWSAAPGACVLTTGLAEVAWILRRIRPQAVDTAFLDWSHFQSSQGGLFLWEDFVSGKDKASSHTADAQAAVEAFRCALPDPRQKNAVKPNTATRSLIGGALLWAEWSTDVQLLHTPCLVIRP